MVNSRKLSFVKFSLLRFSRNWIRKKLFFLFSRNHDIFLFYSWVNFNSVFIFQMINKQYFLISNHQNFCGLMYVLWQHAPGCLQNCFHLCFWGEYCILWSCKIWWFCQIFYWTLLQEFLYAKLVKIGPRKFFFDLEYF